MHLKLIIDKAAYWRFVCNYDNQSAFYSTNFTWILKILQNKELNVITTVAKVFPYSHGKILDYWFVRGIGNGSHKAKGSYLFCISLGIFRIVFWVTLQKEVQWAKVGGVWCLSVGSFKRSGPASTLWSKPSSSNCNGDEE